jgi:predicted porin
MNKKLIAAAIAAAVAAPTAALANDVTIYGVVHASIDYRTDSYDYGEDAWDGAAWRNVYGENDEGATDGFDVASRATRIGFKGTEDLANGLKAIWKIEAQADIADLGGSCVTYSGATGLLGQPIGLGSGSIGAPTANQGGANARCSTSDWWSARNAYIGLAGGWGTFLVGRHDTPYKMTTQKLDLFADTLADWNSTIGFVDIRTNSAIAYVSPTFSGFSGAIALVAPHLYSATRDANGDVVDVADADSLAEAWSIALTYDANGFFASLAYEALGATWWEATYDLPGADLENNRKWRGGLGWTGMGFTVGGVYEMEDNIGGLENWDADRWQISAGYTFGNTTIKAMYGQGDWDTGGWVNGWDVGGPLNNAWRAQTDGDSDAWAIGVDHALSKRTKAYLLYTQMNYDWSARDQQNIGTDVAPVWENDYRLNEEGDQGGFSLGLIHNF